MKNDAPKEIRILLLGESNSGKTKLFNQFIYGKEYKEHNTIGVDFETKIMEYKNKKYKIRLFDTAGQERFQSITQSYYLLGDGFFVVFDLTNEHSLNRIQYFVESLKECVENPKIIILGIICENKDKLISENIIKDKLSKYKDIPYIKVSTLKNINIVQSFKMMIELVEGNEGNNEKNYKKINNNIDYKNVNNNELFTNNKKLMKYLNF